MTARDLLARLAGDVGDDGETHAARASSRGGQREADGSILIDGLTLIEDVNRDLGTDFDARDVDTLGGLVFARLGRRARVGDEVDLEHAYRASVEQVEGLRIALVRLRCGRTIQ